MIRNRVVVGIAAVVMATTAWGCGSKPVAGVATTLREAIERTDVPARRFHHETKGSGGKRTVVVDGLVEDDGRYKARVTEQGVPVYEEVAHDDALAVRLLKPEALPSFLRSPEARDEVTAVLQRQQWVLDPTGAPDPSSYEPGDSQEDAVLDAMASLRSLLQIVDNQGFGEFNPDSLEYDKREDPFPAPPKGGPLKRYDAAPLRMPTFDDIQGTQGQRTLPGPQHFRKISVYVRDGIIVEVRESVQIEHRARQLAGLLAALEIEGDIPEDERVEVIRADVNRRRAAEALPPLFDVERVLRISEVGGPITVTLPEGTAPGDLSVLRNRGNRAAGGAAPATSGPAAPPQPSGAP